VSSAVENSGTPAGGAAGRPPDTWSVSGLASAIGETIQRAFRGEVWVRGEIIGYSVAGSGHIYFNLIEPGTGSDRRGARMRVALFKGRQRQVNRDLAAAGGLTLDDGIEVRIRAEVEYYAGSGQVQLIMSGVDPHFTLGVLAADRERILAELAESGLLRRNATVPLALVPLRVGLVTADSSAAHADFLHELAASGYAFEVLLCDSRVQGATAEADLVAALRTLGQADVDVIALVRGGGDRTDLLAFDLASVAKAIALCPLPVFCGVGHEIDTSIADQVAHTTAKTPTACASALVAHVAAFDARLVHTRRELDRAARAKASAAAARLATARGGLGLLAERRLSRPRARLGQARLRLPHCAERHVSDARSQLRSAAAVAAALAPQRTLARGFSITRAADGSIVRDMPASGDTITTETGRATFSSTVNTPAADMAGDPTADTTADTTDRGTDIP